MAGLGLPPDSPTGSNRFSFGLPPDQPITEKKGIGLPPDEPLSPSLSGPSTPVGSVGLTSPEQPMGETDPIISSKMGIPQQEDVYTPQEVDWRQFVRGTKTVPFGGAEAPPIEVPDVDWEAYRKARRPNMPEPSMADPMTWAVMSSPEMKATTDDLDSDDPVVRASAIDKLTGDSMALVPFIGPWGAASFRSALKLGKEVLKAPFTISRKGKEVAGTVLQSGPILPYTQGAEKMLANLWDNVVLDSTFNPATMAGRAAMGGGFGAWYADEGNKVEGALAGAAAGAAFGPAIKRRWVPTIERLADSELGQTVGSMMWKSPQEIFQPAVERLNKTTAMKFRQAHAQKAMTTEIGRQLGKELRELSPVARFEVVKGIRGTPIADLADKTAIDTLNRFEQRLSDAKLSGPYEIEFREKLGKLMSQPFESPEEVFLNPDTMKTLEKLEQAIHGGPVFGPAKPQINVKEAHNALKEMIEDPAVDRQWAVLARDLFDIPATIPEHVAQASKTATHAFITEGIYRARGAVKAALKPGEEQKYLKSEWEPFKRKGLYVDRDVELELRALKDIPKLSHSVLNTYFMSPWKMGKVMLRPATHIRNGVSNVILNDWGGLSFTNLPVYYKALRDMRNAGPYTKEFSRLTGSGGTFSVDEISKLEKGMKYNANMIDSAFSWFDRMTEPAAKAYNAEERFFKIAKYIHNIESKGMKPQEAALDAMRWTHNYGEVTRATAAIRGSVAPFFTWQAKTIPLMAETAVKHPVRFWKWIAFYQAMQNAAISQVGMSGDEYDRLEKMLPDYVQRGQFLLLPWRDDQNRLNQLNLTYMMPGYGDLNEWSSEFWKSMIGTPYITIGSALLSNTKFSGAPITYDWEPPGVKFAKKAAYIWEQMMPGPLGTDFRPLYQKFQDDPDAPSWEATLAGEVGFKVTPIDVPSAMRRAAAMQHIRSAEIEMNMKKEIRKATSPDQIRDIVAKYAKYRKEYFAPETEED